MRLNLKEDIMNVVNNKISKNLVNQSKFQSKIKNEEYKILIDPIELQQKIIDYIYSDEMNKLVENTIFSDKPECRDAIAHGMLIASMLTCKCQSFLYDRQR